MEQADMIADLDQPASDDTLHASGHASGREPGASLRRIDTHVHILPPAYAAWLDRHGIRDGDRPMPGWSVEGALDLMEANGIAAGIVSVSTPGVNLGSSADARAMARTVNDFAADIVRRHPDRFGFYATLTLPDVDGALAEIDHAFDVLGADGVILLSNHAGRYLGDPAFEPVMAALNARKAVVFVHPSGMPGPEAPGIPAYAADFLLDTTRAAISLARSRSLERHPDLKIILSHAGGFVPYAAERLARTCSGDGTSEHGLSRLKRFYFDTALSSTAYTLPSLLSFADPSRITFGTDWPFAPKERSAYFRQQLDDYPLTGTQRLAIACENAKALFPRFA